MGQQPLINYLVKIQAWKKTKLIYSVDCFICVFHQRNQSTYHQNKLSLKRKEALDYQDAPQDTLSALQLVE